MIQFRCANSTEDLLEILRLQVANEEAVLQADETKQEGFVTVKHNLDLLRTMSGDYQHIVATEDGQVIGYSLVMLKSFSKAIPVLVPMFRKIESINYNGQLLVNVPYVVMGQVCIAKPYRGMGVFQGLYKKMQSYLADDFQYLITEVATRNTRSIRAHQKVGFQTIANYHAEGPSLWE